MIDRRQAQGASKQRKSKQWKQRWNHVLSRSIHHPRAWIQNADTYIDARQLSIKYTTSTYVSDPKKKRCATNLTTNLGRELEA